MHSFNDKTFHSNNKMIAVKNCPTGYAIKNGVYKNMKISR